MIKTILVVYITWHFPCKSDMIEKCDSSIKIPTIVQITTNDDECWKLGNAVSSSTGNASFSCTPLQ